MNNKNIGMVYVATRRPHYVAEAFLSAHSARDFAPDLPITLYTDLPDLPLARSPCFSNVVPIETRRSYKSLWPRGSWTGSGPCGSRLTTTRCTLTPTREC